MSEMVFPDGSYFKCNSRRGVGESMHSHHYHDSFEIYYLSQGSCHFFIDNRSYDVSAGDLVLIPEGIIHRTNYGSDEEYARTVVEFPTSLIPLSVQARPAFAHLGFVRTS